MSNFKRIALLATFGVALLAGACETVVIEEDPGRPVPPPRPRPIPEDSRVCPEIYAPVCGVRRGDFEAFENSCKAVRSGYRVVGEGGCDRFTAGPVPEEEPRACTREYRPVCGTLPSGRERTFGNACEADAAGARILFSGEC